MAGDSRANSWTGFYLVRTWAGDATGPIIVTFLPLVDHLACLYTAQSSVTNQDCRHVGARYSADDECLVIVHFDMSLTAYEFDDYRDQISMVLTGWMWSNNSDLNRVTSLWFVLPRLVFTLVERCRASTVTCIHTASSITWVCSPMEQDSKWKKLNTMTVG